jgi:hypothetical protein
MRLAIALALCTGIGCSAISAAAKPSTEATRLESKMFEQEDAWNEILQLADEEFLSLDEEKESTLASAIGVLMRNAGPDDPLRIEPVLAMYGPRAVDLRETARIPSLIATWHTGLRSWQVNRVSNLHVLVKHSATGELTFSSPRYNARRGRQPTPSAAGDPPEPFRAATTHYGVMPVDLASQQTAPIAPGLVAATTIEYDLRSRTIRVEVDGPRVDLPRAPELVPYVTYALDKLDDLPLDVEVPPSVAGGSPAIVKVATQVGPEASVLRNANGDPILVAHLVLIRLDRRPLLIPAPVPVQPVASPGGGERWNAEFAIDLRATDEPLEPGTWHVFIDAGAELLGPFAMDVAE